MLNRGIAVIREAAGISCHDRRHKARLFDLAMAGIETDTVIISNITLCEILYRVCGWLSMASSGYHRLSLVLTGFCLHKCYTGLGRGCIRIDSLPMNPSSVTIMVGARLMDQRILTGLKNAKKAFPQATFIVFGSQARGTARADSDLDVCALFPVLTKDPFDLAYDVRSEIHKYLDVALDVIICEESQYQSRGQEQWTIEHSIMTEGVPV
jgi:predicted nucleotidyltransferase